MFLRNFERTFSKRLLVYFSTIFSFRTIKQVKTTMRWVLHRFSHLLQKVRNWNNRNVFPPPHEHIGDLLRGIWGLIMTEITRQTSAVSFCLFLESVCVCPPLYRQCAKLDRPQRDGAGLITRSHLNVGQQKVASEGKRIKVGFSPPPLFLFLFLMGVCFFGRVTWVLGLAGSR